MKYCQLPTIVVYKMFQKMKIVFSDIKNFTMVIGVIAAAAVIGPALVPSSASAFSLESVSVNTIAATTPPTCDATKAEEAADDGVKATECLYARYINPLIKLLSAVVGVLAVLSLVVSGVQMSAAGSDPQQIATAKQRIINTLLGVIAYIFIFALLNWVIPGGVV